MPIPNDPLQPLQWYIDRSVRQDASVDLNVLPVWADYSGAGVHVGIFDELIESAHPDLVENYDSSLEIAGLTYDVSSGNGHGTAVAGIIGASANGDGVAGIAYDASITSAPVIYNTSVSFSAFVTAMSAADRFDVVNMSFGSSAAFDGGAITQAQWVPVAASYEQASAQGRNGLGTIFVAAAGNYRTDATNSGLSHYQAERHTIVVGAVGADGNIASYSSEGANLLVVAPSSSSLYYPDVTTTDQTGVDGYNSGNNPPLDPVPVDYTIRFGGTSAASPMVAGVVALMLEANPDLGWRDVRDILAISAHHTGRDIGASHRFPEQYNWQVNGATNINGGGYHFSNDYGFGLVDALAAVRLAETWQGQRTSDNEQQLDVSTSGPATVSTGNSWTVVRLSVGEGIVADSVTIDIDLDHYDASTVEIRLVSPSGTASTLFNHDSNRPSIFGIPSPFRPWTFHSNAFMGEDANGTWRLMIRSSDQNVTGTLDSATLHIYGDAPSIDDIYYYTNEFGVLAGVAVNHVLSDDDGGTDTLNAASVTGASTVNLRPGLTSLINGQQLSILPGTAIENAFGGDGDDLIVGNGGANWLQGGRGGDRLVGYNGDDSLSGGAGNDTLLGGRGADVIDGGDGYDTVSYAASAIRVAVDLAAGTGAWGHAAGDTLDSIERVVGSAWDDVIVGDGADNWIDGGTGGDRMRGGDGNDVYIVDDARDTTVEVSDDGGIDRVVSSVTRGLSANIENLRLVGTADIDGTGNRLANSIIGNDGANILAGRGGADRLTGGLGNDGFVFNTALSTSDLIVDFSHAAAGDDDTIILDDAVFTALHDPLHAQYVLEASQFLAAAGAAAVAQTADQHVIYDTATGTLYYDSDGVGGQAQVAFAVLAGRPAIDITDFLVV